jgi:hypothetical protein
VTNPVKNIGDRNNPNRSSLPVGLSTPKTDQMVVLRNEQDANSSDRNSFLSLSHNSDGAASFKP